MTIKSSLLALSAMASIALFLAPTAGATAEKTSTSKSKSKQSSKVVTVKSGDTLESIAKDHKTTYMRLFNANKKIASPDVIDVGDKIRIPKKTEKLKSREVVTQAAVAAPQAAATATQSYTTQQYTTAPVNSNSYYVGNGMWCTDYVHSKRPDVAIYGNAGYNWVSAAEAAGKSTGSKPREGAVAVTNGHVAYVEKVNSDGSYQVSEMGWNYKAGQYNERTVESGAFGKFIY